LGFGGPSTAFASELGTISTVDFIDGTENSVFFDNASFFFGASPSIAGDPTPRNEIKKHKVKKGDTFSSVAAQFGITLETLRGSNMDVKKIRIGQELTILPVSGTLYTVRGEDTIEKIADRFGVDGELIKKYNPTYIKSIQNPGTTLVLPNTKKELVVAIQDPKKESLVDLGNYFLLPAKGWNWGKLHEYNAVDIANTCGSPIYAAADGVVIEESSDGLWNNGYGNYVLIEHPNKTKTRYAHTLKNTTKIGDVVSQGEKIALIGSSGNTEGSTGCHVHFEIIGAKNSFALK
jgi:murein DD-endopeptidase MepM/ murein hydrolase activator NlpD